MIQYTTIRIGRDVASLLARMRKEKERKEDTLRRLLGMEPVAFRPKVGRPSWLDRVKARKTG